MVRSTLCQVVCGLLALCAAGAVATQQSATPTGTWTGRSLCLANKPVCKDERVVYHIERTGPDSAGATPLKIAANKLVNGREEEMGVLSCRFTPADSTLVCPMPAQYRAGEWRFRIRGREMTGGLALADGTRFRDVHVQRVAGAVH